MGDSYILRHEQCPECAKNGRDKHGDNMGVFSDGHKYCFSCRHTEFGEREIAALLRPKKKEQVELSQAPDAYVLLPKDVTFNIPTQCIRWAMQYGVNMADLMSHGVMWSESIQRLIFPVYDGESNIIAWQGRDFLEVTNETKKRAKWFGVGNLKDVMNVLGKGEVLVLVEDIVSAIKLSKCNVQAMPLYGCHINSDKFRRLYQMYGNKTKIVIWLDPDKRKEAVQFTAAGKQYGLDITTQFSERDPKEENYMHIYFLLGELSGKKSV